MLSAPKTQAELQIQRAKLVNSYNSLLEEFSSNELRTVGNYDVGRLLGKGSFGKVYLATHKFINGSKVCLKQARKEDANLPREIHHHRQFLHPHIVRLYEVVITESSVWLALEYCAGDELYHYLTKHGSIDPPLAAKIFAQLLGAVSYVHSKSCVHRDLKLENILLDKHGNVKLCDFGFTREYEGKSSYLQTWCGTVCYSAPEMLKGEKYAGEKVDVWSLGVILYALLCGELPFDEDDENATKMLILKEEPKYPESMPQEAKELIVSLLSKRPILRPSLSEILMNPWLADHAPQQQAILKLQQPAPFSTPLEIDTLERLRKAGLSTESVTEHVLSQRCDALAGWWALLLEKEERKEIRRKRRRKERELEGRASRRVSTASANLIASIIRESEEERVTPPKTSEDIDQRGRHTSRTNGVVVPPNDEVLSEPLPIRQPIRRTESSQSPRAQSRPVPRPVINPRRRSQHNLLDSKRRSSALHLVVTDPGLLVPDNGLKNSKTRYQPQLFSRLTTIKQWFKGAGKRAKSQAPPPPIMTPQPASQNIEVNRPARPNKPENLSTPPNSGINPSHAPITRNGSASRPRLTTQLSNTSHRRRSSHSPSPVTPQSSFRRGTPSNLRGRQSTSSSVSSVRSTQHAHHTSHSKHSSVSSTSIDSPHISSNNVAMHRRSIPGTPVKILPAPPGVTATIPGSHRGGINRAGPPPRIGGLAEANAAFTGFAPPSPGIVFAKRKRTPFKGPMLAPPPSGPMMHKRRGGTGGSGSRSGSVQGRASGEIIEEEDEDGEEVVEEVDYFAPVTGVGEFVVEERG